MRITDKERKKEERGTTRKPTRHIRVTIVGVEEQ
jgi:hypothetical protein